MLLDERYVLKYSKNRIRYLLIATAADTIIDFQIFRYVPVVSGVVDRWHMAAHAPYMLLHTWAALDL